MRYYFYSIKQFHAMANPVNCRLIIMEKQRDGRYDLMTQIRLKKVKKAEKKE